MTLAQVAREHVLLTATFIAAFFFCLLAYIGSKFQLGKLYVVGVWGAMLSFISIIVLLAGGVVK